MKRRLLAATMALLIAAGGAGAAIPAAAEAEEDVAMDLKSWYTEPAENWESEAMPIGNGYIGGMVFGGVDNDHIQVNEHSLWSGGPASSNNYNFGISTESADAKVAINELRAKLQEIYSEFTETKSAYRNENGTLVAYNYSYGDAAAEIAALQKPLYGDRSSFGYYQTLGDIYISDPDTEVPSLETATSNYEPAGGETETADKLFDSNSGSKWFAGNAQKALQFPVTVEWSYSAACSLVGYELTSANDVEGRDPSDWTLYGSTDGETYVALDSRSGQTFSGRGVTNTCSLTGEVRYRYFKLEITATREALPPQLAEITLTQPETTKDYTDYIRSLDIRRSVAEVSYKKGDVTYSREYFASYPDNVMVIRLTASEAGKLSQCISVSSEQSAKTITAEGDTITMVGRPIDQRADGLQFAQQVKIIPTGGQMTIGGTKRNPTITVTGADEILILMAAATNYQQVTDGSLNYFSETPPLQTAAARVTAAAEKGYEKLLAAHKADYTELFARVELDLGATDMPTKTTKQLLAGYKDGSNTDSENRYLETLYYQFGRYLLISSSREAKEGETTLPANLQGIWAQGLNPPWNSDYHTNINLQMNYWPAEQTNLSECHLPLLNYIHSLVTTGEMYADHYYATPEGGDVRGWAVACGCNIWNHVGSNDSEIGLVPSGGAWLAQHIWEHYQFTQDTDFLRENYDTMLGAALFWVDNLWTDERDGTLVVNPSYSPENGGLSLGTAYDQSIVWEIFNTVLKAADVLGYETSELAEIEEAMANLYSPLQIGLAGQFMEWKDETLADTKGSDGHRHVSQLYGLCPGTLVVAGRSEQDDAYIEAMKTTLRLRGDGGTGWSMAWKINFWARLRDGDHAHTMVTQILKESTLTNLFDTHPPFQIDGNFGATAGMTEMLLQSQGESIDLLAALPNAWGSGGSVKGLKARGNFEIDMAWANQQLTNASVTAVVGGDCTLNYHSLSKAKVIRASDGAAVAFTTVDKDTITFATEAGETYDLVEIPQDKRFPQQLTLLRTSFNNLYSDAILEATGCPDGNGAYVESFEAQSPALKIGLMQNDVIRALGGETVADTATLQALYDAVPVGDEITLTVWRGDKTIELSFLKMETTERYGDIYFGFPGRLSAGGYIALSEGVTAVTTDNGTALKGQGAIQFRNLIFYEKPTSATAEAMVSGDGAIEVRLDDRNGDVIATIPLADTAGEFKNFAGVMGNASDAIDERDLYLIVTGDVTLRWLAFGSDALLGDVNSDGAVNTTDARLVLQYAVGKIGEEALNLGVADVNGDGAINTTDARLILQYAVGKISSFT